MAVTTAAVDSTFIYILVFSLLLFFAIVFLMVYFLVRYRRARNPRPTEIEGHTGLEILWIGLATLLVITMFFYGLAGFRLLRRAPADSLPVKVTSRQWSWLFEYPNGLKDGADRLWPQHPPELHSRTIHSFTARLADQAGHRSRYDHLAWPGQPDGELRRSARNTAAKGTIA
jgi:heme/copper-type cytochrome/quinol oxidase subunit 2